MPSVGMRRTTRVFGVVKGADSARVLRSGRRLWPDSGEGKIRRGNDGDEWLKLVKTTGKGESWPRGVVKAKQEVAVIGRQEDVYNKRWGLYYSRRQRRKFSEASVSRTRGELAIVIKPSCCNSYWLSCFLVSVLRYARRVELTLKELSAFVLTEPISGTYASRGIQFLQGPLTENIGICEFFGITGIVPLFSVDFSAVPLCFQYLHSAMLLRSAFRSFFVVNNLTSVNSNDEVDSDCPESDTELQNSCKSTDREHSGNVGIASDDSEIKDSLFLHASVRGSRLAGRNGQYRNILNSRGIQRRRSSLRKRKARNPMLLGVHKTNGALASDLVNSQRSSSLLTGIASSKKLRSLVHSSPRSLKESSSAMVDTIEVLDSSVCSANLLIAESDKCYRVQGVIVTLEMSASKEWLLTVKKDGSTRCTLKAGKVMRPGSSNRFTHVTMFTLDNGWKLEFPSRQDWVVFKNLYKECSGRNIPAVAKFIPVPGVREVSGYAESNSVPFQRPDSYISVKDDELSRALARRNANYDLDLEDEEWLNKFNNESPEHVSVDTFESMIDALEKAYYCNPDDFSDEKLAANLCRDLGSNAVIEAVYNYWMKKRKQKRSLLLRVFQGHQSKKAPLIPNPLLRKRRSFKRQPSHFGRGKQPSVLQAIAAEQDALEEKNAVLRVEEAKASADKSMELAIVKRKRAQILMENADLAAYKATMLMRIAEAAQVAESTEVSAEYFLD
ncbi:enhancer of polycomb-like protein [Senna tora]|uniref:Enhancer of polycomb-like protein n=1 Tax=Senna tora TaxID=362788 RepID=A0A834TMR2_9FABA|nr:enhancer of polycomb-like protein [Senna tora]